VHSGYLRPAGRVLGRAVVSAVSLRSTACTTESGAVVSLTLHHRS